MTAASRRRAIAVSSPERAQLTAARPALVVAHDETVQLVAAEHPASLHIGVQGEAAVRLITASDASDEVKNRLARLSQQIRAKQVAVSTTWQGEEF